MKIMTLGLARALTPHDWTAPRPDTRGHTRHVTGSLPRLGVRRVTVRLPYPTLAAPRHRAP